MNGLFDPDISGTGQQPQYFDEMKALYTTYRVDYCRINIRAGTATTDTDILVFALPFQTSSTAMSINNLATQAYFKKKVLTNEKPVFIKINGAPSKFIGINKITYRDSDLYWGTAGANPTSQYYCLIGCVDLAGTLTVTANFLITITYYVTWFRRINIGLS
jgi:hypothetical protein